MDDAAAARDLYLDLMKRCLTNWVYGPQESITVDPVVSWKKWIVRLFARDGFRIVRRAPMDPDRRARGRDILRSPFAHTMIGFKRLDNIRVCAETAIADKIPGDFIEAGVWRGGAAIFMRAILKAYGITDRTVWFADSFAGFPPPDRARYPQDAGIAFPRVEEIAVSLEEVKDNVARYGLLDGQVRFLKGFFKDTLPDAPIGKLALIRLDADLYESTMQALDALYPKLSAGGYLIVDDFNTYEVCRRAVLDYRKAHGIDDALVEIDEDAVYWRRSG